MFNGEGRWKRSTRGKANKLETGNGRLRKEEREGWYMSFFLKKKVILVYITLVMDVEVIPPGEGWFCFDGPLDHGLRPKNLAGRREKDIITQTT